MKRYTLPIISIIFILLLAACASPATPAATEAPATEAPTALPVATEAPAATATEASAANAAVLFKIIAADGTSFDVTLDAVKALPLQKITVENKVQEGPKLADVLALAGVTEFTEITISGSSAPCTLTFEQVDDNTILDFSNRGTMKLATTYISKADWTKDITEIVVK